MATASKAAKKPAAKAPAKKAADKSSAAKAPAAKAARKPNAAFMKAMTPSPELAAIVGDKPLPRTEVTKKVWEYIKGANLQDVKDKRLINPDDKLKKVLGTSQVHMMKMSGLISKHLS